MLKIKDNVDLIELEKFGFVKNINGYIKADAQSNWFVVRGDRKIYFNSGNGCWSRVLVILFDLIQAELVEKVGE